MKHGVMFKPGTVALAILIAIVGYGTYTLVSNDFQSLEKSTLEQREQLLECSDLNIEVISIQESNNSTTVTFRTNKEVKSVKVNFGDSNVSGRVKNITAEQLETFSAPVSGVSKVFLKPEDCSRIFSN